MRGKVILAGGSGFLGRAVAARLASDGWTVCVLSRDPRAASVPAGGRVVAWDGRTLGQWADELEGAEALVNFTGRSINCVHNEPNRRAIIESRVEAVRTLASACQRAKLPPRAWVQCSAIGVYGDAGDRWCVESDPIGTGFLASVCQQWEGTLAAAELGAMRRVVLRIGTVMDANEGALPVLVKLVRRLLGGAAGSGRQYMSWVHRDDVVAAFQFALATPAVSGMYNLCAPTPVTNAECMRALRRALGRPWIPPAPAPIVRVAARFVMNTAPELVLEGQRASPARLQAAGFAFQQPEWERALRDLLR